MKTIYTLLLLSFLSVSGFYAQTLSSFLSNGKYGFKNGDKEVISARYAKVYEFTNEKAWVNLGNEWFLIDEEGKKISRSNYQDLSFVRVPFYSNEGLQFNELIAAKYPTTYFVDTLFDDGVLIPYADKFDVYAPNGNLISDSAFSQVFSPFNVDYFEPKIGEYYVIIKSDGSIQFSEYTFFINTGWSNLWYKKDLRADLRDLELGFDAPILASFPHAEIPNYLVLTPDPEMGEYGEWYYTDQPSRRGELLVWDSINGEFEYQLYNLRYNKMMTEKSKEKLFLSNIIEDEYVAEPVFVISNAQDSLNFWIKSRAPISTLPYDFIRAEDKRVVICEKAEKEPEMYDITNDELIKTPAGSAAVFSTQLMMQSTIAYEEESGETYNVDSPQFYSAFYFIRMKNSKVRVMNTDFYTYPMEFDTVFQLETEQHTPIVYFMFQGKYGALDLTSQRTTGAIFDSLVVFSLNDERGDFLSISEAEVPFYYTISGQKLFTKSNSYELFNGKKGVGVRVYPDYPSGDENEVKLVIQPLYKELNFSEKGDWFEAKNTKGKWGIVSVFGDTVVPFQFEKFRFLEWSFNENDARFGYQLKNKRNIGYYDFYLNRGIPCMYSELGNLHLSNSESIGIQTYGLDKTGVFSPDLKAVLPNDFDAIFPVLLGDKDYLVLKKNGKYKVVLAARVDHKFAKELSKARQYDYVIDTIGLVNQAGGFDLFSLKDGSFIQHSATFEKYFEANTGWSIFMQNGKLGISDNESGKVYIKPTLTDVMISESAYLITTEKGMSYYLDVFSKKKYKITTW